MSLPHGSAFFLYLHQSADKRRSNATGAKDAGSPTRPHPPAKEAIGDKPEESEILWPGPTLSLTDSTAILSLGIMGVSSSRADNCTGYDALVSQSAETIDLGHGLKQTSSRSQSILFSNDSMYNLVAGECASTMLQTEDGKAQSMGYCSRRDKDGDTQSIAFHFAPGADKGEWKSIGGTGKFAGKQGSGWAQAVLVDGKNVVVKWGGDCH